MRINLAEVTSTGKRYEGQEPPEILEVPSDDDVRLLAPIHYKVRAVRVPGSLIVSGELETDVEFRCARCDRPFTRHVRETQFECSWTLDADGLQWTGRLDDDPPPEGARGKHTEEAMRPKGGDGPLDSVDLTEDMREAMIVCFPGYPVCSPDCKGLCPKCGENLNTSVCTCGPTDDNRWALLEKWGAR